MTTLNSIIGDNIRRFREQFGLSQEKLAEYLSVSHAVISYYETGKRSIPTEVISKVSALFGIDGYDLYEEDSANQQANIAFAFRASYLTDEDVKQIANFREIVRNYLHMKTAMKDETIGIE
ncbi:helix-turn-helix domain-containing protein [Emticicia sp. 21SJ11W-3]|uniref:helix-turn-helix domain-containing protein n=1 Tax=Emticicia sp. 21SJ11W-3 TaxID=2916755 RepID=UPI00209EE0E3|nr:helix-turn-helix transcriptional regulator [Emticicia sp. 21SJ11W-3]UTA66576.1 helix-turn-helix domain-containing protein [Emticicia sp. 21SJ11W-3]